MSNLDPVLAAALFDQDRRLRAVERVIGGEPVALPIRRLQELYLDASRVQEVDEHDARHWAMHALHLDCCQLLALAKLLGDPFPWQPVLLVLDACAQAGHDVADAQTHLLEIAQDLLRAQGLELVRPRDLMGTPIRMKAAADAIRTRIGIPVRGGKHG